MEQRTPNFTPSEKECLFRIVSEYAHILENKETNRINVQEKLQTWEKISAEFNSNAPIVCYRTSEQLRRLYENKKKDIRRKAADYKKQSFLTGGGPPPEIKWDPVDEMLMGIINRKTINGLVSQFDSDSMGSVEKNQRSNESTISYEFTPNSTYYNEDKSSCSEVDVHETVKKTKCPPQGLARVISNELNPKESITSCSFSLVDPTSSSENRTPRKKSKALLNRRRPQAGVKTLTSSDVSEKYNILLDRRLVLIEKQIQQANSEESFCNEKRNRDMKILILQEEICNLQKEEKKLKIELLKMEITSKRTI